MKVWLISLTIQPSLWNSFIKFIKSCSMSPHLAFRKFKLRPSGPGVLFPSQLVKAVITSSLLKSCSRAALSSSDNLSFFQCRPGPFFSFKVHPKKFQCSISQLHGFRLQWWGCDRNMNHHHHYQLQLCKCNSPKQNKCWLKFKLEILSHTFRWQRG